MEMIWHETVRNYRERRSMRCLQKLQQDQVNRLASHEY